MVSFSLGKFLKNEYHIINYYIGKIKPIQKKYKNMKTNPKLQHLLDSGFIKKFEKTEDEELILTFPDGTVVTVSSISASGDAGILFIE